MHEYSIITSLIEMCEREASAHNATAVERIKIALGERSGVESALLRSAFETFKLDSVVCAKAVLEIESRGVMLACEACGGEFGAQGLQYGICPNCQSHNVKITQGKELDLLNLELVVEE